MDCEIGDACIAHETIGEGIPVIMLHGFTLDRRALMGCMEPVFQNREGWKRIYLDLPGMGDSAQGSATVDADSMVELLLRFIDNVVPEGPFVIVGQSYAGYLAPAIMRARKERSAGVMLLCPVVYAERSKRELPEKVVLEQDIGLIASLDQLDRRDFLSMTIIRNRKIWSRFQKEIIPGLRSGDPQFLGSFQRVGYSLSKHLVPPSEIFKAPALVLTGKQDSFVGYRDAERMMINYPAGTFAVLDRAGHLLQIEQEAVFNVLVSEWLDRVEVQLEEHDLGSDRTSK